MALGLAVLISLALGTGLVAAFYFYIPFGALMLQGLLEAPDMQGTMRLLWLGTAAVGLGLLVWGRLARLIEREASPAPGAARFPAALHSDVRAQARLSQIVTWSTGGRGTVFTLEISENDVSLLADALQSGDVIEVPQATGVDLARVIGKDVQQVWGGPNVPFFILQRVGARKTGAVDGLG